MKDLFDYLEEHDYAQADIDHALHTYQNTDLSWAMHSGNEIMLYCKEYLVLPA